MRISSIEVDGGTPWLHQSEKAARIAVLVMIAGLLVVGVISARGLFADGAYFFYQMLQRRAFFDFDEPRLFAQILTQAPVVLAIDAGARNLNTLIRLQSAGLIGIPLALWFASLLISFYNNLFWFLCLAFAASYLSSGFFSVGEYNIAYSASALAFSLPLKKNISAPGIIAILFASLLLTRSYEAMIFLGPILFTTSIYRAHRGTDITEAARVGLFLAAFIFAVSFGIAGWSIIFPRDPGNLTNAAIPQFAVEQKFFLWYLTSSLVSIALLLTPSRRASMVFASLGVMLSVLFLANPAWQNSPSEDYSLRSIAGLALSGILALALIAWLRSDEKKSKPNQFSTLTILCLTVALSIHMIQQSCGFAKWAGNMETISSRLHKNVPVTSTTLDRRGGSYDWGWTDPWLSALLKGNSRGLLLTNKEYKRNTFLLGKNAGIFREFKKAGPLY